MNKIIYTIAIIGLSFGNLFSQYCGGSGSTQCTASGALSQPGLSPPSDSLAAFVNGTVSTTVIQFKNFNQIFLSGQTLTVQSLRIDSIGNLPSGLCWATDKANNTYANSESGCIKINGTTCSPPGQYKLYIGVTANIGFPITTDAEAAGLRYFVRVGNQGDVVPSVDTLQTVAFYNTGYSTSTICVACPQFTFTQNSTVNSSCATPNGSITVAASGGSAPYNYTVGTTTNSTGIFSGLSGGTYNVIASDASGCRDTVSVTVTSTTPVITVNQLSNTPQSSCTGNNGAFSVSATGGTAPYNFAIPSTNNATGIFSALGSGSYTVTATDANSCSGTLAINIANNIPAINATTTTTNASAQTAANGTATATGTGGVSPYTYLWSNTQTTATATGLLPGNYSVTVTDANGCAVVKSVTVSFNTSINNLSKEITDLRIFPNPAVSNVTVDARLTSSKVVNIEVLNYVGQIVQTRNIASTDRVLENLDVHALPKGLYFIKLVIEGKYASYPLVIE
jgi:hypothetical protein